MTERDIGIWFPAVRCGSGTDVFTERLCNALKNHGHRAEITWLPHRAEYLPWTVAVPEPPRWANVVHVNTWLHTRFVPHKMPVVATEHLCVLDPALNPYETFPQKIYHRIWIKQIERRLLTRAQKVTSVSEYTAGRVRESYGVDDIEVIWNSIDLSVFRPTKRYLPNAPFRLLFVGNWSSRKGADLLVPIMRELGAAFELWIVSARRVPLLKTEIPNIHILPSRDKDDALAELYRNCDALLFPTRLEGFGLVVLEAQACGLPVIATNNSSLPEIIEDGITGILCTQDDVSAFVYAARRLAANPKLRESIQRTARANAETNFGVDRMTEHYLAIYRKTLAGVTVW